MEFESLKGATFVYSYRAFSHLFREVFGTKLGKGSMIFSQIGKIYLLNLDFSATCNWESFRSVTTVGIFPANWLK